MTLALRTFYKEILTAVFGVLLLFLLLFLMIDTLDEVKKVGQLNYGWGTLAAVVLLSVPEYVYQLLPICTLIGTILALSGLAARSELIAWRASGLSLSRLMQILVGLGLLLSCALWLIGDAGIVRADVAAREIKDAALERTNFYKDDGGFWGRQNITDNGSRMINVLSIKNSNTLVDVRLYELSADFNLRRIVFAKTAVEEGTRDASGLWTLQDARVIDVTTNEQGLIVHSKDHHEASLNVDLGDNTLAVFRNYGRQSAFLTFSQLNERMASLSSTGQSTRVFEVAYWQKVFYPLSVLVMLLLALPFAFMQTRKGGVGIRVFTGIMLGLVFFTLTAMAQYLGALLTYSPVLLAVAPSTIFLLIAVVWLKRITRVN